MHKALLILTFKLSFILIIHKTDSFEVYSMEKSPSNLSSIKILFHLLKDTSSIAYHYEESTYDLVNYIISKQENQKNNLLINYDNFPRFMEKKWFLPNQLQIILLKDHLKFSEMCQDMVKNRRILFVCTSSHCPKQNETSSTEQLIKKSVLKMAKVTNYLELKRDRVKLYMICYYCGKMAFQYNFLSDLELDALKNNSVLPTKSRTNLQGHKVRVSFTDYEVYFYCEGYEDNETGVKCRSTSGLDADLLAVLKQSMNFELSLVKDTSRILEDSIDVHLGGHLYSERNSNMSGALVDLNNPIWFLYTVNERYFGEYFNALLPFQLGLWFTFILSLIIVGAVVHFIEKYFYRSTSSFCNVTLVLLQGFLEQNAFELNRLKKRYSLFAWFLSSMILTTAYKAKLSAININPPTRSTMTVENLAENDYSLIVSSFQGDFLDVLSRITNSNVQKLLGYNTTMIPYCEAFTETLKGRVVYSNTKQSILYYLVKCRGLGNRYDWKRFEYAEEPYLLTFGTWLFSKDHPLASTFSSRMTTVREAGIYSVFQQRNLGYHLDRLKHVMGSVHTEKRYVIGMRKATGLFLVWLMGMAMAVFVFVIEVMLAHLRRFTKH